MMKEKAVERRTDNKKTKRKKKSNGQTVIYNTLHRKELEDTKGVIRIRKSHTDRQHNGHKKKKQRDKQ